jgi:hypothetical protein
VRDLTILGFGQCGGKNMKNLTIDEKILDQMTCFDSFNCNWLWYLVDAASGDALN